ncbi:hypothetical protein, partial [Chitinophaga sp. 22620]|uniref:hypothetical protein n=1 Tax=Chitinophaga sp. 22620 TaxID=3453952 RepID=UPI003F844212
MTDLQSLPTVVIPAGDGFVDVNFVPADDNVIEATEKLILTPAATGFTFNQPISFDITDQDLAGATITLSAAPASVAEGASSVITATLNGGVTAASNLVITLTKGAGSTAGSAEHGVLGPITINAGQTTGTVTLTTNTDQVLEANETVMIEGA